MATKKKTQSRKSAAKNKSANRQMIWYFVSLVLIFFAVTRLGIFGVTLYNLVRLLVGVTAYLGIFLYLAFLLIRLVKRYLFEDHKRLIPGVLLIYLGIILCAQAIFAWRMDSDTAFWNVLSDLSHFRVSLNVGGGFIGWLLYFPIKALFSKIGVFIVSALLVLVGALLAIPNSLQFLRLQIVNMLRSHEERQGIKADKKIKEAEALALEEQEFNKANEVDQADNPELAAPKPFDYSNLNNSNAHEENKAFNFDNYDYQEHENNPLGMITDPDADWNDVYQPEADEYENEYPEDEVRPDFEAMDSPSHSSRQNFFEQTAQAESEDLPNFNFNEPTPSYQLPTSQLLTKIPPKNQSRERTQVKKNIAILENTFQSFGISASVESAVVGPSVTKYEIKLAQGVRVNRVANLADDLALALAAKDVRIEAPIPGKSLVGIEIPNLEIATVGFRDMIESAKTDPKKLLEIPLGKALDGSIRTFDLSRMPHLLIAGSTGSGKSVAVNGMIASILMKALPSQVKFLMVDPKMVELSVYNDIPQLLIPVVTNPRKAARALQKVVDEMENRYELFSRLGVRNIEGYNEKIERQNQRSEVKTPPLPLIVVIVDELADLMMVASKEVEDAIIRLGQKARAAGIHMILATQRPSVDVISGLIKANVPSRVAFAVSSGTDSRTILDSNGAEKLLGRGDMLFKPIDENHPIRLQGAFLSDEDVEKIVNFIKSQTEPDYDDSFDPGEAAEDDNRAGYAGSSESSDPLFEEAKAMVISSQKASVAQLQRILKVGFNRATDLMNELEAAGVVGPAKGTTPRKVLMNASGDYNPETDE